MTQPKSLDARVTDLEARVAANSAALGSLQSSLAGFTARFTALEQQLGAGEPRLLALEAAARGFETRVQTLEAVSHSPSNADQARLDALEVLVNSLQNEVTRLSTAVRPGRTVLRERVEAMNATMQEILNRLPPAAGGK